MRVWFGLLAVFLITLGTSTACDSSSEGGADTTRDTANDTRVLFDTGVVVWDTGASTTPADTAVVPDTDQNETGEGSFGWPCENNTQCDSGWCVQGPQGYICTKLCEEDCPSRYNCKSIQAGGADIAFVCVPDLECEPLPGPDLVGDGLDTNCDGIDGEVDNGVFVARNGDDLNRGSIVDPVQTIGAAIQLAVSGDKRDVYVASGVYSENILLAEGKGVFGGYSSDFETRDPDALETAVLGDPPNEVTPAAVTAIGVGAADAMSSTIFRGFTVFGANAANVAGSNSYAMYLRNVGAQLYIINNRIFGGAGGNGLPGEAGGDGEDGDGGSEGDDAYDVGRFDGSDNRICLSTDNISGGGGGKLTCEGSTVVSGGKGGDSHCPAYGSMPTATANGALGQGPEGGAGGAGGWDLRIDTEDRCGTCRIPPDDHAMSAGLGRAGDPGEPGLMGEGCVTPEGRIDRGAWRGVGGGDGGPGTHGSGGGGGGSGGGVDVLGNECVAPSQTYGKDIGGSGGGGGSGGCRGLGGRGGSAGGGSFGIFLLYDEPATSVPTLSGNIIRRGSGGAGGAGGPGGAGGVPGLGAPGGLSGEGSTSTFCAFAGGTGGDGGQGGHGGGGGGGCGGASYGIYVWASNGQVELSPLATGNTFEAGGSGGVRGAGGASLGRSGGFGSHGAAADTNF